MKTWGPDNILRITDVTADGIRFVLGLELIS